MNEDENGLTPQLLLMDDMLGMIRHEVTEFGTQRAFAHAAGVTEQFLSDVLRNRRSPGPKIASYFGFNQVVAFVRKEKKE